MNRYLLLRDNKQSGPYTASELIEKGIKPYDLVWLDGRSAAWRYPSEIEELKAHAPVVEEQPFDRFYKKPVASPASAESSYVPPVNSAAQASSQKTVSSAAHSSYQEIVSSNHVAVPQTTADSFIESRPAHIESRPAQPESGNLRTPQFNGTTDTGVPATDSQPLSSSAIVNRIPAAPEDSKVAPRKIYVTLPGKDKPQSPIHPTSSISVEQAGNGMSQYMPRPAAQVPTFTPPPLPQGRSAGPETEAGSIDRSATPDRPHSFSGTVPSNTPSLHPKYVSVESRDNSFSAKLSADDPYTDKPYTDKVAPTSKIPVIPIGRFNWAITAIGAVCLLLGGVIIGLVISNRNQTAKAELDQLVNQIRERETAKSAVHLPAATTENVSAKVSDIEAGVTPSSESTPTPQLPAGSSVQPIRDVQKPAGKVALTPADTQEALPPATAVASEDKPTPVQPAVNREERAVNAVAAEAARKNIRQLVSVGNNKYKTGVLGGISELELTVTNKSDFELDQVEVEVEYLGPEKRVVKTQMIVFSNVKPGKTVTQEVPRTNRGVTVNTSIRSINSKSLGLASAGL